MTVFNQKIGRRGNAADFLKVASFSLAFIQAIAVTTESVLPLYSSNFFVARLCGGKGRYLIQGNTLIMSHKLAPLGRTHIRQGSSTPETTSESSSPLKEWIHTQNFGGSPSVFPEPKQLSGKNTVTKEAVHVAEAARLNSTSSSSDGVVTKMRVARASVASASSVSGKNTIASKVTDKQVVSKEPVNKPVNQSMEKILAEKQKNTKRLKQKK